MFRLSAVAIMLLVAAHTTRVSIIGHDHGTEMTVMLTYLMARPLVLEFFVVLGSLASLYKAANKGWSYCSTFTILGLGIIALGSTTTSTYQLLLGLFFLDFGHLIGAPRETLEAAKVLERARRRWRFSELLRRILGRRQE